MTEARALERSNDDGLFLFGEQFTNGRYLLLILKLEETFEALFDATV